MDPQTGEGRSASERTRSSIGKYLQKLKRALGRTSKTRTSRTETAATPGPSLGKALESPQSLILAPTPVISSASRSQSPVRLRPPLPVASEEALASGIAADVSTFNPPTTVAQATPSLTRNNSNLLPNNDVLSRQSLPPFKPHDPGLQPSDNALHNRLNTIKRVEKLARVRVHHYCHRCQSSFGLDGVCAKCEHKRCKKCIRFPERRVKENAPRKMIFARDWDKDSPRAMELSSFKTKRSTLPMAIKTIKTKRSSLPMVISVTAIHPSEMKASTSGTWGPLTLQSIRHTCHHCDTPFIRSGRVCQECAHLLCPKCPEISPVTRNKLTPGTGALPSNMIGSTEPRAATCTAKRQLQDQYQVPERTYKSPRQRIKYTCECCSIMFGEKSKTCMGCGHRRCESCGRIPPKRNQPPEPDPAGVKSLEARLAALDVVDDAPSMSVQLWVDAV